MTGYLSVISRPLEERGARTVSGSHLRGVGLNLMLADFVPDDEADLGRGGSARVIGGPGKASRGIRPPAAAPVRHSLRR